MLVFTDKFRKQALGLDIGNERVVGVLVDRKSSGGTIRAADYVSVHLAEDIPEATDELLRRLQAQPDVCISGLPVSQCFIRNVSLPFSDRKKINRILPLELEDQLLHPVDELILDYMVGGQADGTSGLVVAAMKQDGIQEHLDVLKKHHYDPEIVTLRSLAFAAHLLENDNSAAGLLVLDVDQHAATMVLCQEGKVVFVRYLSYPEHMFTGRPFLFSKGTLYTENRGDAELCIRELCKTIVQSLSFLQLEYGVESSFAKCIVTGSLALADMVRETVQADLDVQVELADVRQAKGLTLSKELADKWQPQIYDHALALALTGGTRSKESINLRKDVFKRKVRILKSKRQKAAAAGLLVAVFIGLGMYSFLGYTELKKRYTTLGKQMNTVFTETFPETTRIVDPLQQMKVNIREAENSGVSAPVIAFNKKNLELLADISSRIPASMKIHVTRLLVDQESVQIKGTTDTFNTVDSIQNQLRQSPFFQEVAIMSATADKNKEQIRFQIRLILTENS